MAKTLDQKAQTEIDAIEKQKCKASKRQYRVYQTEFFELSKKLVKFYPNIENAAGKVKRTHIKRLEPKQNDNIKGEQIDLSFDGGNA